jgi:polysaccharide export outer membrane protein
MRKLITYLLLGYLSSILIGCSTINIFEKATKLDAVSEEINDMNYQHIIKPDDKLSLSLWNHNDVSIGSAYSIYNSNESFGKWLLVQQDSSIALPELGLIKVGGLTCSEASSLLANLYSEKLKKPIVAIKILNKKITVLGEVNQPGVYILEKEQTKVAEILGEAQGLTFYANKSDIQLVRNNKVYVLDFTSKNALDYNILLHSGDVINVLSKNEKRLDKKAPTIIPFASLVSSIAILYSVLRN